VRHWRAYIYATSLNAGTYCELQEESEQRPR
jgi:hypothetical protein